MPADDVARVGDTCNVWVLRRGREGVCIDFGSGRVLDRLDELGLDRITDVLVTHAHREVAQGLRRAVDAGIRIWVPPVERELFTDARGHWSRLRAENTYETRQESFTLFEDVEIAGTVDEYRTRSYGGIDVHTLPTPGHTVGSVTYLVDVAGRRTAFCGDLVHAGGQLWSLAATQWSYGGTEGQAATLLSLGVLARQQPAVVLPAHGEPIEDPEAGLAETARRLSELMELRRTEERPFSVERWLDTPWREVSPHLLLNRTSIATSYALLSENGAALLVDWGYDLWTGWPLGVERHHARPLLQSIGALRSLGVERVETVVATHYHDDHVAGANLLRDVEGTEVWAPENVAPILEEPTRYDLPCLWYDPIPVDRVLQFGEPVQWHEYELRVHPLPGHTRYAAAIELEVDGRRVLATGDQQSHEAGGRMILNYQYRNRFALDDYVVGAELYERLAPDLLLTGHWGTHELDAEGRRQLAEDGRRVADLHRELLAVPDAEGVLARIVPYRAGAACGSAVDLAVELRNPFAEQRDAQVALVLPSGWRAEPGHLELALPPNGEASASFRVVVGDAPGRHAIGADVTIGDLELGVHADALVTVT